MSTNSRKSSLGIKQEFTNWISAVKNHEQNPIQLKSVNHIQLKSVNHKESEMSRLEQIKHFSC